MYTYKPSSLINRLIFLTQRISGATSIHGIVTVLFIKSRLQNIKCIKKSRHLLENDRCTTKKIQLSSSVDIRLKKRGGGGGERRGKWRERERRKMMKRGKIRHLRSGQRSRVKNDDAQSIKSFDSNTDFRRHYEKYGQWNTGYIIGTGTYSTTMQKLLLGTNSLASGFNGAIRGSSGTRLR